MDIETKTKLRTGFTTGSCATASSRTEFDLAQITTVAQKATDIKFNTRRFTQ